VDKMDELDNEYDEMPKELKEWYIRAEEYVELHTKQDY